MEMRVRVDCRLVSDRWPPIGGLERVGYATCASLYALSGQYNM